MNLVINKDEASHATKFCMTVLWGILPPKHNLTGNHNDRFQETFANKLAPKLQKPEG